MTPTKQTVYFPKDSISTVFRPIDLPIEKTIKKEGYFFTPEQLNEYTRNVIKQALETAAENADSFIDMNEDAYIEGNVWSEVDKESITNTFEETYKNFKV